MKQVVILFFLLMSAVVGQSAETEFTTTVSSDVVEVGQPFQVTFTIYNGSGNFRPPTFENFQIVGRPSQMRSTQNINGARASVMTVSYTIVAKNKGTFTIASATLESGSKTYKTDPVKIKVTDVDPNGANTQRNRQNQRKEAGENLKDQIFIKTIINKPSVYQGESIGVTFKLYSKLPLQQFIGLEAAPNLNGFWKQDIDFQKQARMKVELLNGVRYETAILDKNLLIPQRSGELIIDPMSVKIGVQVQSSRKPRTLFDQLRGNYEMKEVIASSKPLKINVKPLPSKGKPDGFSGAVGTFDMVMAINKDSIVSNEAVDLKVTVIGSGNLALVDAPKLTFPPDFEVYDPETKNRFSHSFSGTKGQKVFNYLVIPRHSGDFKLDPFSFSYFDLKSESYKTITAKPIEIRVEKGDDDENVVYNGNRKSDVELLNSDIRFIHISNLTLLDSNKLFYGSVSFYLILGSLILLAIFIYFFSKKFKSIAADKVGLRKTKANKLAKKRLSTAKKHLDAGENRLFYVEISAALFGYFGDKFNINIVDLSQEKIIELLSSLSNSEDIIREVKTVLEETEMARFAPDSETNAALLYEKATEIISKTEALPS